MFHGRGATSVEFTPAKKGKKKLIGGRNMRDCRCAKGAEVDSTLVSDRGALTQFEREQKEKKRKHAARKLDAHKGKRGTRDYA